MATAMANRAADVTGVGSAGEAEGGVVVAAVGEATTGKPRTARQVALGEIIGMLPFVPIAPFCVLCQCRL